MNIGITQNLNSTNLNITLKEQNRRIIMNIDICSLIEQEIQNIHHHNIWWRLKEQMFY